MKLSLIFTFLVYSSIAANVVDKLAFHVDGTERYPNRFSIQGQTVSAFKRIQSNWEELIVSATPTAGIVREWKIWAGNITCGPSLDYTSNVLLVEWGTCDGSRWHFGRAEFSFISQTIQRISFTQTPQKSNEPCSSSWQCEIAQFNGSSQILTVSPSEPLSLWERQPSEGHLVKSLTLNHEGDERNLLIVRSGNFWNALWNSRKGMWLQTVNSKGLFGIKRKVSEGDHRWIAAANDTFAVGWEQGGALFSQIFGSSGKPLGPSVLVSTKDDEFFGVGINSATYEIRWKEVGISWRRNLSLRGWEGPPFTTHVVEQFPTPSPPSFNIQRDIQGPSLYAGPPNASNSRNNDQNGGHFSWWWVFAFPVPFILIIIFAFTCIACRNCFKNRERSESTPAPRSAASTASQPPPPQTPQDAAEVGPIQQPPKDEIPSPTLSRSPQVARSAIPSLPERFFDPIFGVLMLHPVVTPDGRTYERAAIEEWINEHHNNPVTREPLQKRQLIPNRIVSDDLEQWLRQNEESQMELQTHLSRAASSQSIGQEEPSMTK